MNTKEGVQMGISSRFTVGVHMLTLLAIDRKLAVPLNGLPVV